MSPRLSPRRSGRNRSSQETVIAILVLIVIVETFLLVRPYLKKKARIEPRRTPHAATRPVARLQGELVPTPPSPLPPPAPVPVPWPLPGKQGKIAIIIDDNGYNAMGCEYLSDIPQPLAVSILPDLEFSKETAYCARMEHKEVMLHLPLEPHTNRERYPENYIIKTRMSDTLILSKLDEALDNVPRAEGVNNHMGSKATENRRVMTLILRELKKRGLFFVDSMVTDKSICESVAREARLPFSKRDIFLDNENTRSYIEGQFKLLAQEARRKGKAIGIGHARPLTWQIVREQLEKLSRQGFEIVPVKDLMESPVP